MYFISVHLFAEHEEKLKEYESFEIENEGQIAAYYNIRQELDKLGKQFRSYIVKSQYLIPFLQPGRLVKVCYESKSVRNILHCKVFFAHAHLKLYGLISRLLKGQ